MVEDAMDMIMLSCELDLVKLWFAPQHIELRLLAKCKLEDREKFGKGGAGTDGAQGDMPSPAKSVCCTSSRTLGSLRDSTPVDGDGRTDGVAGKGRLGAIINGVDEADRPSSAATDPVELKLKKLVSMAESFASSTAFHASSTASSQSMVSMAAKLILDSLDLSGAWAILACCDNATSEWWRARGLRVTDKWLAERRFGIEALVDG